MKVALTYILAVFSFVSFAQDPYVDSLRSEVQAMEKKMTFTRDRDTSYVNLLLAYTSANYFVNKDTLSQYARKALMIAESIDYPKGSIYALISMAFYHSEQGEYEQSLRLLDNALKKAQKARNLGLEIGCHCEMASVYSYSGNLKLAIEKALTGISLGKDVKNKDSYLKYTLSLCYENLGGNLKSLNQNEEALQYLLLANELNEDIGKELSTAQTRVNIAEVYQTLGRYQKALNYLNESIPVLESFNSAEWLAFAYRIRGEVERSLNEFNKSLASFAKAQHIHENIQDKRELSLLYIGLSKTYLKMDVPHEAEKFANLALRSATDIKFFEGGKQATEVLYRILKSQADLAGALAYHEMFKAYSDSIFNDENSKSLAAIEAQMDYQKKENELILESQKAASKQRMLIYFSSGGVMILLTILFLTQRNRQLERKLNSLLAKKNKVLQLQGMQLKAADQSKNKLFSIISHDLRTPVGSLNSLLELLQDKQIEINDFIELAPQLNEQVKHLSFTLNNLLQWSQQQMNGLKSNPSKNNLFLLANESIDLFRSTAVKKELAIENHIPDDAFILGDHNQISIVLRNLINNAIKFTPKEGSVSLFAVEREDQWQFEIRDTGVGIPPDKLERIMSKQMQIDSSYGTDNEKGTGIGINICKEMISLNGGEFWVQSQPGKGSSFFFTLKKFQEKMQPAS